MSLARRLLYQAVCVCDTAMICHLQRKLSVLEEQHAALSSVHKEKLQALDLTLAEAARLDKEVGKLMGSLEKLESRCVRSHKRCNSVFHVT